MGDWLELRTQSDGQYVYIPQTHRCGAVKFRVRAANDACVALTSGPFDRTPITEVCIGGWYNTKSTIRTDKTKPYKAEVHNDDLLDSDNFVSFWMQWNKHKVAVGLQDQPAFLQYLNPDLHPITHFAVRTGRGSCGDWQIEVSPLLFRSMKVKPVTTGQLRWVRKTLENEVPQDALICGHENGEVIYVGRAQRGRALIVGKYVPSKKCAIVGIYRGLSEHEDCEILCGYNGMWLKTYGNKIPPHAFEGGYEQSEPYYVGRARCDGNLIPGKVLPPHRLCYVPYSDTEVDKSSYEILVVPEKLPSAIIWNSEED